MIYEDYEDIMTPDMLRLTLIQGQHSRYYEDCDIN